MRQRRTPVHLAVTAAHKSATKCGCHRANRRLRNIVSKRPTDKRIQMERKWNKDPVGRIRKIV